MAVETLTFCGGSLRIRNLEETSSGEVERKEEDFQKDDLNRFKKNIAVQGRSSSSFVI